MVGRLLESSFESDGVPTSVNAYLVNTGRQLILILIDSGTGQLFGPSLGKLRANLEAAGYRMDQVDAVLITHVHGDHVGGLVDADTTGSQLFRRGRAAAGVLTIAAGCCPWLRPPAPRFA